MDDASPEPSIPTRLLTWRTAMSIAVAALIVGVAVWRAPIDWASAWDRIRHADLRLYLLAMAAYYTAFLVRGLRWQILLRNAGEERRTLPLTGIIVVSFFVNCVVPAKMGDVYRAFLVRQREGVSAIRAFGTVIAERLLDLIVLMGLLVAAAALVFRNRIPGVLIPYVVAGVVLCLLGIGVLGLMRAGRGKRVLRLLPETAVLKYETFRQGTVHALGRWPLLIVLTVSVWALEASRLGLVVYSLGLGHELGPSQFVLIALVAALLTTVPFLPGGLGLVEAGMVAVLITIGGIATSKAVSVALLDRSISYGSVVLIGFVVFMLMHVRPARARRLSETSASA